MGPGTCGWGECSTTFLAGGGIRGGQVLGASDKSAAYPIRDAVDPVDVQATIYHLMGLDPSERMLDLARRPWPLTAGKAIERLL